jgi:hypothetical protein
VMRHFISFFHTPWPEKISTVPTGWSLFIFCCLRQNLNSHKKLTATIHIEG